MKNETPSARKDQIRNAAIRTRRRDIYGRDYFVWAATSGYGDGCGHDHPTKKLAEECARLFPAFPPEKSHG